MNVFIHIGSPKTGTTSIQQFLQANREWLCKEYGIWVPKLLENQSANHGVLNVASANVSRVTPAKLHFLSGRAGSDILTLRDALRADIESNLERAAKTNCNTFLMSNEGLYFLDSVKEYERLSNLVGKRAIQIILVLRERGSFKRSYSMQLEKDKLGFSEIPGRYNYVRKDSYLYNYERKINILEKVFKRVHLIDYDLSLERDKGIMRAFFSLLGLELSVSEELFLNKS